MFKSNGSVASYGIIDAVDDSTRQNEKPQEILILGPEGAGKTLFSRRLQESNLEYQEATIEGTIPTVCSSSSSQSSYVCLFVLSVV